MWCMMLTDSTRALANSGDTTQMGTTQGQPEALLVHLWEKRGDRLDPVEKPIVPSNPGQQLLLPACCFFPPASMVHFCPHGRRNIIFLTVAVRRSKTLNFVSVFLLVSPPIPPLGTRKLTNFFQSLNFLHVLQVKLFFQYIQKVVCLACFLK